MSRTLSACCKVRDTYRQKKTNDLLWKACWLVGWFVDSSVKCRRKKCWGTINDKDPCSAAIEKGRGLDHDMDDFVSTHHKKNRLLV